MKSRLFCCLARPIKRAFCWAGALTLLLLGAPLARAGDAPAWMHAVAGAQVPPHDDKTNAVLLYEDVTVTVVSGDKVKTLVRDVYKILRPEGRDYGVVRASFYPRRKITGMRGWCIPAQGGKDYEVKDREAMEVAALKVEGGDLVTDEKVKLLQIPAADPGNVVGYEYEVEESPLVWYERWIVQGNTPAREQHFHLHLPPGWEFRATWLNHPEVKPVQNGDGWEWVVENEKGIHEEADMPPYQQVLGHMFVAYFPAGSHDDRAFSNWSQMGDWYRGLTADRRNATPELKSKVAELTANQPTQLEKMRAIARWVQDDIRYVSIQLGIGGFQPHFAGDIFLHRYGDCKDKATLAITMLKEIGVESYYVVINTERGSVTDQSPANLGFNHVVAAIRLPEGMDDPSLTAIMNHPKLGRLLFYDPTSELTPLGRIPGYLQANFGLVVLPQGGELVKLPQMAPGASGVRRLGHFKLAADGVLEGNVEETRLGDSARASRVHQRSLTRDADRIKPIETILSDSLSVFAVKQASIINQKEVALPLGFRYTFVAPNYAKQAGDLLIVRPRVLGVKSRSLLEKPEPRAFAIEFDGPREDAETYEIEIPPGYEVEDLPPVVEVDFGFASYRSRTVLEGRVLRYTRNYTVKELSVPASRAGELKKLYRLIAGDERNTAVLKLAPGR